MLQMKPAEALCYIGKKLVRRNMVHYLLGTISMRLAGNPPIFLVKPADCLYELAKPSDFVKVYENGTPINGSSRRPSLNFLVHAACYKTRPDIGGIIHAHPEDIVTLMSYMRLPNAIPLLTQEAVWMVKDGEIPIVEDLDPKDLAQTVAEKIIGANAVAIRNHGIITVGKDIWEAYGTALVVESEAAMIVKIRSIGEKPNFRNKKTADDDLSAMPPVFSPKFKR